jgi:hypothetical protein
VQQGFDNQVDIPGKNFFQLVKRELNAVVSKAALGKL